MSALTPLQQKVFDAAKASLEKTTWFKGICTNPFPVDADIEEDFQGAVTEVEMETAYWDAPDFFSMFKSVPITPSPA